MPDKKDTKKKDNKVLIISVIVIVVCAIASILVWKLQYHGESPEYISTQKQINKNNAEEKKQFNKIKQDSFPTVQEAHDYLVQETGHNNLNSSAVSLSEIQKLLKEKYGETAMNALLSGQCLSQDMTPDQEQTQEVILARLDKNQKDYVGFPYKSYATSVYKTSSIENEGKTNFPVSFYSAAPSKQLSWTKDGSFALSTPIAADISCSKEGKDKYCTMIVFIKVPSDNDTSFNDFKNEMNSINLTINGKKLGLSGSHEQTKTSEESQGLQFTKNNGSANHLNAYDADKIFAGSVVPVTFDLPLSEIGKNINVRLNGEDQGTYKFYENCTYKF